MDALIPVGFFGGVAAMVLAGAALPLPAGPGDPRPFAIGLPIIALIAFFVYLRIRFTWRQELVLNPTELRVFYVYSGFYWRTARIDLASVRQFTLVRGPSIWLAAESAEGPLRRFLGKDDADFLLRVALLLAEQRARIAQAQPAIRVAVEALTEGPRPERLQPPLNSKIKITRQEAGITLDFPMSAAQPLDHRPARFAFKAAIFILVLAGAWFGIRYLMGMPVLVNNNGEIEGIAGLGIAAIWIGFMLLASSAGQVLRYLRDPKRDDNLRQLAVAGNLLVRTSRDDRKNIWYRQEIQGITVEDNVEIHSTGGGEGGPAGAKYTYLLNLLVALHNGEKAILIGYVSNHRADDYRPKAELEWIATMLRQALTANSSQPPGQSEAVANGPASSQAIHEKAERSKETRISP